MPDPIVSILLPAYDAETTLATCLASIRRQREQRFECVVVDDGSRDATLEIARRFETADSRFRVLACEHAGISAALNTGLETCRGAFVARMDADDWMHRDRLQAQLHAFDETPGLAAVGCHVRIFPRRELTAGRRAYETWLGSITTPEDVRRDAFVECPVAHPTWMVRREVALGLGWADAGWAEDYDFLLRSLAAGHTWSVVARRLLGWRDSPSRLSRVADAYSTQQFTACKAAFLADGPLKQQERYVLWGYGDTGRTLRSALLAHGKRPSRIVELHPGRLGNRIHGAPVVPPEALADLRGEPIVVSVAGARPRALIREALDGMGFRESRDYFCAA